MDKLIVVKYTQVILNLSLIANKMLNFMIIWKTYLSISKLKISTINFKLSCSLNILSLILSVEILEIMLWAKSKEDLIEIKLSVC
jgi:hypothetical protein